MSAVYLDNASTTPIYPQVVKRMSEVLSHTFGNPSSTYGMGREAKSLLEQSRKTIARVLGCDAKELLFTSGATEGNNWILTRAVNTFGIERIITSAIEHPSVLECITHLKHSRPVQVEYVSLTPEGHIDIAHVERLLKVQAKTLLCLMHVNNEIGAVTDAHAVARLSREHGAYFHSDMVQSVGKIPFSLHDIGLDFAVGSAHKFHGPKGVGFIYVKSGHALDSWTFGGAQEKGHRAGTESVHNIAGMASALEIIDERREENAVHLAKIKAYAIDRLSEHFEMGINGGVINTSSAILNVQLDWPEQKTAMLAFQLDLKGIAISRGSACQSGSNAPSHVLSAILPTAQQRKPNLRLSFSAWTQQADIDALINALLALAP